MDMSRLKRSPLPSLKDMSAVKIVTELFRQPDMKSFLEKFAPIYDENVVRDWINVLTTQVCALNIGEIDIISEKITHLPLPQYLKDYVKKFVNSVLINLYRWAPFYNWYILVPHYCAYRFRQSWNVNHYQYLRWTSRGDIDLVQTSEALLLKDTLSLKEKYHLACYSVLLKEIEEYGLQVVDNVYVKGYNDYCVCKYYFVQNIREKLLCMQKSGVDDIETKYSHPESISRRWNIQFLTYMWLNWSSEKRAENFEIILTKFEYPEHLHFLLSEMNDFEMENFLAERFADVFQVLIIEPCWLDWLELFLNEMWHKLEGVTFCKLIKRFPSLKYVISNVCLYDHYIYILEQFRQKAPKHLIDYVLEAENGNVAASFLMKYYLWGTSIDSVQWILFRASERQKRSIIFSAKGMELCVQLMGTCQWKYFIMFLHESLPEESLRLEFKERMMQRKWDAYRSIGAGHQNCCIDPFSLWWFGRKGIVRRVPVVETQLDDNDDNDDNKFGLSLFD